MSVSYFPKLSSFLNYIETSNNRWEEFLGEMGEHLVMLRSQCSWSLTLVLREPLNARNWIQASSMQSIHNRPLSYLPSLETGFFVLRVFCVTPAMLTVYSWLWAQNSLLSGLTGTIWGARDQGQVSHVEKPNLLYYLSSTRNKFLIKPTFFANPLAEIFCSIWKSLCWIYSKTWQNCLLSGF